MTLAEFFARFWWLLFPVWGMIMALVGVLTSERRAKSAIDLLHSYVAQGKEPPPELLRLASSVAETPPNPNPQFSNRHSEAWTAIVFTALAAGFSVGYVMSSAWPILLVAVVMGVMAVGAVLILIFGRKK